jgi:hypothetical protein
VLVLASGCTISPKIQILVNALSNIRAKVDATNSAVMSFGASDGLVAALSVQQKEQELDKAVQEAVSIAHAGSPVNNECDAAGIVGAVNSFAPSTNTLLHSIVAKKPEFDRVGVSAIVAKDLGILNTKTNLLIGEAYTKLPCSGIAQIRHGIDSIQASYADAASVYGVAFHPGPTPPKC